MNCPDCDTLMYYDNCRCGFKLPPKTTIEIKQVGMQVSNEPIKIKEEVAAMLNGLTGRALADASMKYCREVLNKAKARNAQEKLQRMGERNVI
jgi:hypothetical protein